MLAPPTGYARATPSWAGRDRRYGEILVGGYVESFIPSDNRDPAIAAVTPAGALDTAAFAGGTGYALLPLAGSNDQANGLARQPDGKLVIGGTSGDVGSFDFLAARFSASGVLDTGFASPAGYTTTDFSGATSTGSTLALSNTGVAYVGGNAGPSDFGIAAFHASTPPPTGGGGGGGGAQPAAPSVPCRQEEVQEEEAPGRRRKEVQEAEVARSPSHARSAKARCFRSHDHPLRTRFTAPYPLRVFGRQGGLSAERHN